jgi:IclR family mhp operon transcriptional activator
MSHAEQKMDERPYVSVRALERGLQLLVEMARLGRCKPVELSEATGFDRTTVYRLLETLRRRGFVSQNLSDGSFGLTENIRRLGEGFTYSDRVCSIVAPVLTHLVSKISWPSDFATFETDAMLIRETTHHFSPFSMHRSMVGTPVSLTRTALGRAVLWAAQPDERLVMLNLVASSNRPEALEATDQRKLSGIIVDTQRRGYAWSINEAETGISGIALPVRAGRHVAGAINVIFFTRALNPQEAAERYLPALKEAVQTIEETLAANVEGARRVTSGLSASA